MLTGPKFRNTHEPIAGPQPLDRLLPNGESGTSNPGRVGALAAFSA